MTDAGYSEAAGKLQGCYKELQAGYILQEEGEVCSPKQNDCDALQHFHQHEQVDEDPSSAKNIIKINKSSRETKSWSETKSAQKHPKELKSIAIIHASCSRLMI